MRMWKSTDSGNTWTGVDTSNDPVVDDQVAIAQFDAIQDPSDPTKIIFAWVAPRTRVDNLDGSSELGEYKISIFDMTASTWGTPSTGGPPSWYSFGSSAYNAEQYSGAEFNIAKDTADGSIWLSYISLVDAATALPINGISLLMQRPSIIQLDSGGSWGSPVLMMAEPTVPANYRSNGIAIGDASRVHVIATQYTMVDTPTVPVDNDWMRVFHQSYSGTLGAVQLIEEQLFADSDFSNTASPLVTRQVSGTTELLFGYGYTPHSTPPSDRDPDDVEEHIARAISATNPTWTIQTLPGINNTGAFLDGGFCWCTPVTHGTRLIAYTNFFEDATGDQQVRVCEYVSGAWVTAFNVYATALQYPYGDLALCNLVNDGAAIGVVIAASFANGHYYYESTASGGGGVRVMNYVF